MVCVYPRFLFLWGRLENVFSPNFGSQSQPARKERAEPESGDCGSVVVHRVVGAEQLQQQAAEQVSLLINQEVDRARN
jgi:hypothetical protein